MSLDLDLMKRAYFIFIINILLVASCARKQEVAKADYEMDIVPSSDTLVFSDYFEYEFPHLRMLVDVWKKYGGG